jgi:hypothetical protein
MTLEPKMTVGADMLAASMFRERMTRELERMVAPLSELVGGCEVGALRPRSSSSLLPGQPTSCVSLSAEVWVALGYYALLRNQPVRANHLAAKVRTKSATNYNLSLR